MTRRTWEVMLASALATGLWGQGTTSRLLGVTENASGAPVAGAKILLRNERTGVEFTTRSSASGAFLFAAVQPGSYRLTVEAPGFSRFVSNRNRVNIGQTATVRIVLTEGDPGTIVEVTGVTSSVSISTSGNLGNLLTGREIRDFPVVGTRARNPLALVFQQPGVVSGANAGGGSHVHGARDRAWNYTLDGVDVNESNTGGAETTPAKINPDSLAELRVLTTNFTADYGRSSGGQVAMVTRSGANDTHGSLWEFYRAPRFAANEWENNLEGRLPTGEPVAGKRQFVQHIFGGAVGGPFRKNKTFFFINAQGLRAVETRPVTRTVYTAEARSGLLRYVKGGRNYPAGTPNASVDAGGQPVPAVSLGTYNVAAADPQRVGLDPVIRAAVNAAPLPNRFDYGDGLNTAGFAFNAAQADRYWDVTTKIDHVFNLRHSVFARVYFGHQNTLCDRAAGGQEVFPGQPCLVNTYRSPWNVALNWRFRPSPYVTHELVLGLNRFRYDFRQPGSFDKITMIGPVDSVAQYYFGNQQTLRTWQWVDNWTYLRNAHALKLGSNIRLQRHEDLRGSIAGLNANQDVNFSPSINVVDPAVFGLPPDLNTTNDRPNFQSHINYLLGRVGRTTKAFVSRGNQFAPGLFSFDSRFAEIDFFARDTWRLRRRFTLDAGLRWEVKLSPRNPSGLISHPDQPVAAGAPPSNTLKWVRGKLFNDAWRNFGPSFGFAWDPFGSGRTSIRANYRVAYDRLSSSLLSNTIFQNIPGLTIGVVNDEYGQNGGRLTSLPKLVPPPRLPSELTQPAPFSASSMTVMDPGFRSPTVHQWMFSVQRQIARHTVAEAAYIGHRSYHLIGAYNANQAEILRNGFLEAFQTLKAGRDSELINRLTYADSRRTPSETGSQMVRRLYSSLLNLNSVAELAAVLAARLQEGRSVTELSGAGPFALIAFPQFGGGMFVIDSNDFSTYHGLVVQVQRRLAEGASFQASWTWSKSLDTRSFDPLNTVVATGSAQAASSSPIDICNRRLNYALSDFDRTHVFQASWIAELPFRNRKVLVPALRGWQLSGAMQYYTGRPFTVYSGSYTYSSVVQTPAVCEGCPRAMGQVFDDAKTGYKWYFNDVERAHFAIPAAGQMSNAGRNYFRGDRWFKVDAALLKRFRVSEPFSLELRAEAANLTNSPSFGFPVAVVTSSTFGRVRNSVVSASRKIQLAVKLHF